MGAIVIAAWALTSAGVIGPSAALAQQSTPLLKGGVETRAPSASAPANPLRQRESRQSHAICGRYAASLNPMAGRLEVIPKTVGGASLPHSGPEPSYCYTSIPNLVLLGEDGSYCCYMLPQNGGVVRQPVPGGVQTGGPPLYGGVQRQPIPTYGGGVQRQPQTSRTGPLQGNVDCAGNPLAGGLESREGIRPCATTPQQAEQQRQQQRQAKNGPIFNFFYINGINTPERGAPRGNGDPGGSYEYEYGRVRDTLALSKATRVLWNEIDLMEDYSHNLSGKDQRVQKFLNLCQGWSGNEKPTNAADAVKAIACKLDDFWQGGGLAKGDVVECFVQSFQSPDTGITKTAEQYEVVDIANRISQIYEQERQEGPNARPNFFIIVAHSQGNFFAEGVAYRLFHRLVLFGRYIADNRLGIIALGSPTRYDALPETFQRFKLRHVTRADDGIHMLDAIVNFYPMTPIFKRPFRRAEDVAPLWDYKDGVLDEHFGTWDGMMDVLDLMNIKGVVPLTTPFMNAHLLDNYLSNPTATWRVVPPNKRGLPKRVLDLLRGSATSSRQGTPVLFYVQQAVRDLKHALLATYAQK